MVNESLLFFEGLKYPPHSILYTTFPLNYQDYVLDNFFIIYTDLVIKYIL